MLDVAPTVSTGWRRTTLAATAHAPEADVFVLEQTAGTLVSAARPTLLQPPGSGPGARFQFSLVVVLERLPTVADEAIGPLIASGQLTLTLGLPLPPDAEARLAAAGVRDARSVFATRALFGLEGGGVHPTVAAVGERPSAAISATLGAAETHAVLDALDGRPGALQVGVRLEHRDPGGHNDTLTFRTPLADVLGGMLPAARDAYVSLVTIGGELVPRRVSAPARSRDLGRLSLARSNAGTESLALTLLPDRTSAPRPWALAAGRLNITPEIVIAAAGEVEADLPVVDDPAASTFPGTTGRPPWFAPSARLAQPAPNDPPLASPFSFVLRRAGLVTGDGGPRAGLMATVRISLDLIPPDGAAADARQIALEDVDLALEVPYRPQGTTVVAFQPFAGEVQREGNRLIGSFTLADDWARLAYGALSTPGFQPQPPRVRLTYAHRGLVTLQDLPVDFGGKRQHVAVVMPGEPVEIVPCPRLEIARTELTTEAGSMRYAREAGPGARKVRRVVEAVAVPAPRATGALGRTALSSLAVRPPLVAAEFLHAADPRRAERRFVRDVAVDAVLPCAELGGLYLQADGDGPQHPMGCQDALRLGETKLALYEELTGFADETARVLRSLTQPGRFLLVPAAYRVTRYAASQPADRAFRPVMLMYAALSDDPSKARFLITATLEADVPAHVRRRLATRLAPLCPHGINPTLDLPTDPAVAATPVFTWAVAPAIDPPAAQLVDRLVQVSISSALDKSALLRALLEGTGMQGRIEFTLPDGIRVASALIIDTNPTGPWDSGPVTVEDADGGSVRLTNRIERPVAVEELLPADDTAPLTVGRTLQPGEAVTVPAPAGAAGMLAAATPATGGVPLPELDVFVEEVSTNVIFVNLVNYAVHGLDGLMITARLQGTDHCWAAELPEATSATISMQLGLLTYLERQVIEYQVTKRAGQSVTTTPWLTWDLTSHGNVVSVTWDSIAATAGP